MSQNGDENVLSVKTNKKSLKLLQVKRKIKPEVPSEQALKSQEEEHKLE